MNQALKEAKISCSRRVQDKQEEEELREQRVELGEARCHVSWKDPWPSGWSASNLSQQGSGLVGKESHGDRGGALSALARGSMCLCPTGPSFPRSSTGGFSRQSQVGSRALCGVQGFCLRISVFVFIFP